MSGMNLASLIDPRWSANSESSIGNTSSSIPYKNVSNGNKTSAIVTTPTLMINVFVDGLARMTFSNRENCFWESPFISATLV
jgi:hypothetical protein